MKRDFQVNFTYHIQDVPVQVEAHGRFNAPGAEPDNEDGFCELDSVTIDGIEIDPCDIKIKRGTRWYFLSEVLMDCAFDEATYS